MIRAFAPADTDAWAALRAELWPHSIPNVTAVFVAESDARVPVGFLELALRSFSDGCDSMPVPHVEGWYVEPGARGQGVGRALMRAAEEWSKTRGFTELASDTELDNAASLRAHEACGFSEVERLIKLRKPLA